MDEGQGHMLPSVGYGGRLFSQVGLRLACIEGAILADCYVQLLCSGLGKGFSEANLAWVCGICSAAPMCAQRGGGLYCCGS